MGRRKRPPPRSDFVGALRKLRQQGSGKLVEVRFDRILHATEQAILIEINEKKVWLPKDGFRKGSDDHTIWVYPALAAKKGL
jgi:hypothetical protein